MLFRKSSLKFLIASLVATVFMGCVKDDDFFETDDNEASRTAVLKFQEAPQNALFFEPFTGTREVRLFSLRRDVHTTADLNQPVTVTFRVDTAAIRAYNRANNASFQLLPDSLFVLGPGITKTGPLTYQMTFEPGEHAKNFDIILNGSKWDLSRTYAMPFVIADPGGVSIISDQESVNVLISIKNKYDGVYRVTGTLSDAVAPTITGEYPLIWELRTSGPNSVIVYDKEYTGTPTHIIRSGPDLSQYGSFGLIVNFDPVTNKITSVTNFYGQPSSNGRSAALDPTGVNAYDPGTKTIKIKYFLLQPGTTVRTSFDETWTYTGPR